MTLHLIVDNTKKEKTQTLPTCRMNCELFDYMTGECGINYRVNPDDPHIAQRCGEMIYKDSDIDESVYIEPKEEDLVTSYTLTEDELAVDDDELYNGVFFEYNGEKFDKVESTYPLEPDYPANRDDAIWYVSPNETFGCWIVNKSKKRFVSVPSIDESIEQGWNKNIYKSPYPLHDHKSSLPLASRMLWYVDEDGYGQYAIIHNGTVAMIATPKPDSWKGK